MSEGTLRRRRFITAALATTAATSLPAPLFAAQKSRLRRRFAKSRPAKNAERAVIYRNDGEFCSWPYTTGFFADGGVRHIARTIFTPD